MFKVSRVYWKDTGSNECTSRVAESGVTGSSRERLRVLQTDGRTRLRTR